VSQCLKQLNKLIDVIECEDLHQETSVQRELALIRVEPTQPQRQEVYDVVSEFMARTPSATESTIVVEQVSDAANLERLITALRPYNITEIVRTGTVAIKV